MTRGRARTRSTGNTTSQTAVSANGNSTNTGRLSVVSASSTPSQAKRPSPRSPSADTASHIEIVNSSVVSTSVMTSAPKYGMAGKSAVAAAAPMATVSDATRRAIAYTTVQVKANITVCARATGSWWTPNSLYSSATNSGYSGVRSTSGTKVGASGKRVNLPVAASTCPSRRYPSWSVHWLLQSGRWYQMKNSPLRVATRHTIQSERRKVITEILVQQLAVHRLDVGDETVETVADRKSVV